MTLPRTPCAVVFDMDGVLVDSETLFRDAARAQAESEGLDLPFEVYRNTIGLPRDAARALVRTHFGGDFDVARFWTAAATRFHALAETQLRLKAGVVDLLDALDEAKLPRAIATSSSRPYVEKQLTAHRLIRRFHTIVTDGDYPRGKPHPDPYLVAAAKLKMAPEDCLALEDSHNGVRAAAAAGMMTIMVPDLLDPTAEIQGLCVRVARDLHEVRALIAAAAA
jgi:HAD superfamily hydrolase (TIGR01509 family)